VLTLYTPTGQLRIPESWTRWTFEGTHYRRGHMGRVLVLRGAEWIRASWKYEGHHAAAR
jgi:hypothetical protein